MTAATSFTLFAHSPYSMHPWPLKPSADCFNSEWKQKQFSYRCADTTQPPEFVARVGSVRFGSLSHVYLISVSAFEWYESAQSRLCDDFIAQMRETWLPKAVCQRDARTHTHTHTRTRHIWMRMGLFKHKVAYKLTSRTETFNGEHIGLVHSSLLKEFHLTKCTPSTIMKPMPSDSLFSMPSFCCRHPKRSSPSGSVIMFHSGSVSHLKIKPSPSSSPSPPER